MLRFFDVSGKTELLCEGRHYNRVGWVFLGPDAPGLIASLKKGEFTDDEGVPLLLTDSKERLEKFVQHMVRNLCIGCGVFPDDFDPNSEPPVTEGNSSHCVRRQNSVSPQRGKKK